MKIEAKYFYKIMLLNHISETLYRTNTIFKGVKKVEFIWSYNFEQLKKIY